MNPRDLIACGVQPTQAKVFAEPLRMTMERFRIVSVAQRAAFVAQCMHESAGFTRLEEGLWYSTPERIAAAFKRLGDLPAERLQALCKNPRELACNAYCHRNGNGGPECVDGWAYRGSGLIQLTGLANFRRAQADSGRPYVSEPNLVRENPADAALTAGLWWSWNDANRIMDEDDFDGLSRAVNLGSRSSKGTPNGLQERRDLYAGALAALRTESTAVAP